MTRIPSICLLLLTAAAAWCSPRGVVTSDAVVTLYPETVVRPLGRTLFGINVHPHAKPNMARPEIVANVKKLGITSCRFPNGCVADLYDWKNPPANWATVEEFLGFCDDIDAEPYYTVNMQGGTDGLEGPAPEGNLDETVKYRHLMPNPCGNTNYHFGTLAETLEFVQRYTIDRALAGETPILRYEMGNENWGQSRTDWPPRVYAKTVEVYAKAMRALLDNAKKHHPQLADLRLYIVAVGYPVMGNNMQMVDTPERSVNVAWTEGLNKLHDDGVIDAVQEHYYPYASANGGALAWVANNLHNIICARLGIPNERLNGYRDPAIDYSMPMEHTEWNVKCWGPQFARVELANSGFEDGLDGWTVMGGSAKAVSWAARRGARGARIAVSSAAPTCEISKAFDCPPSARTLVAAMWVRTATPGAVKLMLMQDNEGEHKGTILGEWGAKLTDMWERVVVSGKPLADTKSVRLAVMVEGRATVYLDEVMLYSTTEESGQCPISAATYEQVLFCVDAFREMAQGGCPRAHLHHLFGDYPCGTMAFSGQPKDLAIAYEFYAGAYGDRLVSAECRADSFGYYSAGNPWATEFNALAPDRDDIPMLSCMASRGGDTLYLLLLNRTSDREIHVTINLNADPASGAARVRTLSGTDIDLPGASIAESETDVGRTFTRKVAPYSAQILTIALK